MMAELVVGRLYEELGDVVRTRRAYERQTARWLDPDSSSTTLRETRKRLASINFREK